MLGSFAKTIFERTYAHDTAEGKETWEQTAHRVTKHVMRAVGVDMRNSLAKEIREAIVSRKLIPAGRYLYASGRPLHQICNCYSGETKAVTNKGAIPLRDLVDTSPILMTSRGEWKKSEVKSFGIQKLYAVTLKFATVTKTLYATANHSWRVAQTCLKTRTSGKRKVNTIDLKPGDTLCQVFGYGMSRTPVSPHGAIHGIVFGDGSTYNKGPFKLRLCGEKTELKYLFNLFPSSNLYSPDILISGLPNHYKKAPNLDWDRSYLLGWLVGYFAADGCVSKEGQCTLTSTDKTNLELVKDVAYLVGIGVNKIRESTRISNLTGEESTLYSVSFRASTLNSDFFLRSKHKKRFKKTERETFWKVVSVEETNREEEVFCATVPETHEFVLEDNILVGNCLLLRAHDSREGWSELMAKASKALMTGAGIGVNYSDIRHEGALIRKSGGTASGPIPLMQMVNECGRGVMQGGVRRCLPGDAPITMEDGSRKGIGNIKAGDKVRTRFGSKRVTHVFYQGLQEIFKIKTDKGVVFSTKNHRWLGGTYENPFTWVKTKELEIGNVLYYQPEQQPTKVLNIEKYGKIETYDIEVEDVHEFVAYDHVSHNSAIWAGLNWQHPDIYKFITTKNWPPEIHSLKAKDFSFPATLDHTNISVGLDDEFFEAYNDDEHLAHSLANSVYWAVIEQMMSTGEPGFYIDTGKDTGEDLRNAPLSADTHVLTHNGYKKIRELVDEPVTLWTGQQLVENVVFKKTASNVRTILVAMSNGRYIKADPNHEFFVNTSKGTEKIPAKTLLPGDELDNPYFPRKIEVLYTCDGPIEDVYCCNVHVEEHSFVAEGVVVSNCTEVSSRDSDDICDLSSINLSKIASLDEFKRIVELGTAFLLAGSVYTDVPYSDVDKVMSKNRRLGLGLMGIHEWLLKRGKQYGPDEELGRWLKAYSKSGKYANAWADKWGLNRPKKTRALAPNGTTSIVAETTGGIEPVFCVAYKRRYMKGNQHCYQYVVDPCAKRLIEEGIDPHSIEDAYMLARDVERRVAFQAWVQQFVDHAISSTINLPAWGSEFNNKNLVRPFGAMLIRYLPQLRGITTYPDGSRGGQPLNPVAYEEANSQEGVEIVEEQQNVCSLTGGSCGD